MRYVRLIGLTLALLNWLGFAATSIDDALLEWSSISVRIGRKRVLELSRGEVKRGRLLAVLGPSGSGKTTFLNSISGRLPRAVQDVVETATRRPPAQSNIAFVYQDDSFFPMLTVEETVTLAYHLHTMVNSHGPDNSTTVAIHSILQSLALTHVASNAVGDIETRGISGGERKRLSLACELVGNPSLLIVDEPTSGLDSFQSQNVIFLLNQLARNKDMAVVITIHQPSSSTWTLIDDVLLLTPYGQAVYFGPREDILSHFQSLGHHCPLHTNPAEFLLDLVSIDSSSPASKEQSRQRIQTLLDAHQDQQLLAPPPDALPISPASSPLTHFTWARLMYPLRRITLLFQRALRQTTRDTATNVVRIGTSILLAFVVSMVHGPQSRLVDPDSVAGRVNIIAQGVINIGMLSMMKTLQLFKRERSVIDRERRSNKYNAFEYLLAKFTAELPFDALTAVSFGAVLHWRTHLHQPRGTFLLVCSLLGLVTSTLGMSIGALFPAGDSAMAIGPALMVIYIIMGAIGPSGVGKALPVGLQPLRGLSPMNHAWCTLLFTPPTIHQHAAIVERCARPSSVMPRSALTADPAECRRGKQRCTSGREYSGGCSIESHLQILHLENRYLDSALTLCPCLSRISYCRCCCHSALRMLQCLHQSELSPNFSSGTCSLLLLDFCCLDRDESPVVPHFLIRGKAAARRRLVQVVVGGYTVGIYQLLLLQE